MKVAIVGTRNPSVSYEQWTQALKDMNLPTVAELVSGGAKGIDSYTKRLSKEKRKSFVNCTQKLTRIHR